MPQHPSETDASGSLAPSERSSVFVPETFGPSSTRLLCAVARRPKAGWKARPPVNMGWKARLPRSTKVFLRDLSLGLPSRTWRVLLWVFFLVAPVSLSMAQGNDRFREVEPGFEDVNDQVLNMRLQLADMRTPTGFEKVYEIVGSDGLFARRAGAVTAVFDRSIYAGNATPLIPAGTVFYLGSLPVDLGKPGVLSPDRLGYRPKVTGERTETTIDAQVPTRPVAQRLDLRAQPGESTFHPLRVNPRVTIWSSESYRQQRVGQLIRAGAWRARALEAAAEQR